MEKSGEWACRTRGSIGEMGWSTTGGSRNGEFEELWRNRGNGLADHGGQEIENSRNYEEIGEMGWPTQHRGSRNGEFGEL